MLTNTGQSGAPGTNLDQSGANVGLLGPKRGKVQYLFVGLLIKCHRYDREPQKSPGEPRIGPGEPRIAQESPGEPRSGPEEPRRAQERPRRAQRRPRRAQERPRRSPGEAQEWPRTAQMQTLNQKRCQKACVCACARARLRQSQCTLQRTADKKKCQKDCVCARARARSPHNQCPDNTWEVPKTPLLRTCARSIDTRKQHPDSKKRHQNHRLPMGRRDGDLRAGRGRSAGGPRRVLARAGFWPVLPAFARAENSRKHRTGDQLLEARPENGHGAQAPRAVSNQGFEGSKCYILIGNRIVGNR